jgi:cytochrome b561
MSLLNTDTRYGKLSIAMHWLMLLLIVGAYASIELRELYPKGSDPREALKTWHFMLGLSVFFLVWLRLLFRLMGATPAIVPAINRWQSVSAKLMHIALYLLMIIVPLLGWMILSAAGKPIPFFGLELPGLITENKELIKIFKERHISIAEAGYYLIGLHTLAALVHHYYYRDNTLTRMLPSRD